MLEFKITYTDGRVFDFIFREECRLLAFQNVICGDLIESVELIRYIPNG